MNPLPSPLPGGEGTLDARLLATLLQLSAGITKVLRFPGGTMAFRAAACTGALYHIGLYVVCGELEGVPAGVYHFDVEHLALTRLRAGDYRGALVEATAGNEYVRHAPATVVASSTWWRNSWKYQARTYRHAFWDSGTLLANLLTVAAVHRLPARVLLGFVDAAVNRLIDVDPAHEAALALIPLGDGGAEPAAAPAVEPLGLPLQPYSHHEIDYPLIREAHEATSFQSATQVADWPEPELPAVSWSGPPIEEVIRKRGSARRFAQTPISGEALDAVLAAGPCALNERALIVNDVDGLASGAYRELEPLRLGDFRDWAGHLDLDQELAADAAVDVYFLADLNDVIGRLGERGYRAAQMDAAIAAGRMYLAAYAAGVVATGLTFYDDEVSGFFETDRAVMFLLAVGKRYRASALASRG